MNINKNQLICFFAHHSRSTFTMSLGDIKTVSSLHPWYVTGFCDGESAFVVSIQKNSKLKIGWEVRICFQIGLHKKDKNLIKCLESFFGVGKIYESKEVVEYKVSSLKEIREVIIPFFLSNSLISKKQADFLLFKLVVELMSRKDHITIEGLQQIVNIKASMNNGLSDLLKNSFPNTNPYPRPEVEFKGITDPHWVAGFTEAEGNFIINTSKSSEHNLGMQIWLRFKLTQHSRDRKLMESLKGFLSCGSYYGTENVGDYIVTKFWDIESKIIPFFNHYSLRGAKLLDFIDFKKSAEIIKVKGHRTQDGLTEILKIKAGMNRGRNS